MANRIALDSGALIKLSAGDPLVRAVVRKWTEENWETILPAPVLAETLRGGHADAAIHRILSSRKAAITTVGVSVADARDAGGRLGRAGMAPQHTVDALIVATAVSAGAEHIVTGDPRDMRSLAGADLTIIAI